MPRPTLRDVHVDRPLTQLSIAYMNEAYIGEQVFPRVSVNYKSDVFFIFDEGAWFRRRAKPRAPGNRSDRSDYALSTASYICLSYALAKAIPDEVRNNSDAPLRPDITATNFVTDGLLLDQERRIAELTTGGSGLWNYSASPTTQWSGSAADPFGDIRTARDNVVSQIGRMPNVAVMSWDVWSNLQIHPDFVDRVKYTRPGGNPEPGDLRGWFGFDKVLIGHSIFDVAVEGQTASKVFIWGDAMWMGYVPTAPALEEPAAGYLLEWGTRTVRRFREDQERQDVVDGEHWTDEIITASIAGAVIYDAV